MNTSSRSEEQSSPVTRTLGERMVMAARLMAAEHIAQAADAAGLDLADVQRELRERTVRQDLFRQPAVSPFADCGPISLPQRVKAQRTPPKPMREAA